MQKRLSNSKIVIMLFAGLVLFTANYSQYQLSSLSYLIIPTYQLTNEQFSKLFTAAMVPGATLSLISGILADRFGVRRCIFFAVLIGTTGIVLRCFCTTYSMLFVCMLLTGFGVTFVNANAAKLVGSLYDKAKLGAMLGLLLAGSTIGTTLAMGTTVALFPSLKSAYLAAAVLAVITLGGWIFIAGGQIVGSRNGKKETKKNNGGVLRELGVVIRSLSTWKTGLCLLFCVGGSVALSTFLPIIFQNMKGLSATASGVITALMLCGNFCGNIIGPRVCRVFPWDQRRTICAFQIIAGVGILLMLVLNAGFALYGVCFLTGIAIYASVPTLISIPIQLPEVGEKYAGTAGGFIATMQLIGCVCLPSYVIAPVSGGNYKMILLITAACYAVTAGTVWALPRLKNTPCRVED